MTIHTGCQKYVGPQLRRSFHFFSGQYRHISWPHIYTQKMVWKPYTYALVGSRYSCGTGEGWREGYIACAAGRVPPREVVHTTVAQTCFTNHTKWNFAWILHNTFRQNFENLSFFSGQYGHIYHMVRKPSALVGKGAHCYIVCTGSTPPGINSKLLWPKLVLPITRNESVTY